MHSWLVAPFVVSLLLFCFYISFLFYLFSIFLFNLLHILQMIHWYLVLQYFLSIYLHAVNKVNYMLL